MLVPRLSNKLLWLDGLVGVLVLLVATFTHPFTVGTTASVSLTPVSLWVKLTGMGGQVCVELTGVGGQVWETLDCLRGKRYTVQVHKNP